MDNRKKDQAILESLETIQDLFESISSQLFQIENFLDRTFSIYTYASSPDVSNILMLERQTNELGRMLRTNKDNAHLLASQAVDVSEDRYDEPPQRPDTAPLRTSPW